MGELIFFGVLILFSILESVARQRKQRQEEAGGGEAPESPSSRPEERSTRSSGTTRPGGPSSQESAETMLPADLWEEIAGLAAGRVPEAPTEPARRRPSKTAGGKRPDTAGWTPSVPGEQHPIHDTHRDYGTAPSTRRASELDWKPTVTGNANAKRVRALLRGSGGADALKQAVMLQEILGPPISMKDD